MTRICLNCSKQLPRSATYRRRYCNANCRVAHNRKKRRPKGYTESITGISLLGNVPKSERKYAIDALRALKKSIDFELEKLGDAETVEKMEMLRMKSLR